MAWKLFEGDCLEIMPLEIEDKSIDMILCDLPFGITASSWDKQIPAKKLWEHYNRIISNNGSVLLFASGLFEPRVMLSNIDYYKYKWVWVKNNSTNFVHAKNRPMTKHESILVFSKAPMGHISQLGNKRMNYTPQGLVSCEKKVKQGNGRFGTVAGKRKSHLKSDESFTRKLTNFPTDVLTDFPDLPPNQKLHTNEKPVALLEYLIKTYTNEGDLVLDNCAGSGTTGVACEITNRNSILIEKEPNYCDIIRNRLSEINLEQYQPERVHKPLTSF